MRLAQITDLMAQASRGEVEAALVSLAQRLVLLLLSTLGFLQVGAAGS